MMAVFLNMRFPPSLKAGLLNLKRLLANSLLISSQKLLDYFKKAKKASFTVLEQAKLLCKDLTETQQN
jgi:hypothetical protein